MEKEDHTLVKMEGKGLSVGVRNMIDNVPILILTHSSRKRDFVLNTALFIARNYEPCYVSHTNDISKNNTQKVQEKPGPRFQTHS